MRHHIVRQNFTNNYEKGVRRAERKSARKNFDIFLKKRFFIFIIVVVVVTDIVTQSRKEISRWKILLQFPHFCPPKLKFRRAGLTFAHAKKKQAQLWDPFAHGPIMWYKKITF